MYKYKDPYQLDFRHVQIAGLDVLQRKFPEACAQMLEALRDLRQQYGGDISVEILAP